MKANPTSVSDSCMLQTSEPDEAIWLTSSSDLWRSIRTSEMGD